MKKAKVLTFVSFLLLQACSEKFYQQRPFNVSQADQVFMANFSVAEEYDYRFALIFNWAQPNNHESRDKQSFLIGRAGTKGLAIPMTIKILRDGNPFLDQVINTDTSWQLESFCFNKKTGANEPSVGFWRNLLLEKKPCENKPDRKRISGPSRTLEIRTLPPGNYHVEIKTLISIDEFSDMETFIEISPYSPKI